MRKVLQLLAKPFIGTGIGQRFPLLHSLYQKVYATGAQQTDTFELPYNLQLTAVTSDCGPGLYLASTATFEPFETQVFAALVKTGDTIIDIGAHVGYYSLIGARLTGKQGQVVAFEASPANAKLLKKNRSANKLKNITVEEQAVADSNGTVTFYINNSSSGDNSLVASENTKAVTVQAVKLDTYCNQKKLKPNIIKIDVEGAENQVLAGMQHVLKQPQLRALFVEITLPANAQRSSAVATLQKAGFSIKLLDEHAGTIVPYSPAKLLELNNRYGFINILAQK